MDIWGYDHQYSEPWIPDVLMIFMEIIAIFVKFNFLDLGYFTVVKNGHGIVKDISCDRVNSLSRAEGF